MKKLFIFLTLLLLPLLASADAVEIGGIYYNLKSNYKTAEVTSNPNKYSENIVIPNTVKYDGVEYAVTSIGAFAFQDCSGLKSVKIPNSVFIIGTFAFSGCSDLTSINIPNDMQRIWSGVFSGCCSLTSIEIPSCVSSIGRNAFENCYALKSVKIPNSVTTIEDYAFFGCRGLTSVKIPNGVTTIGIHAFGLCNSMTSVTIANSVTSIGDYAFHVCTSLTSVFIPSSVTSIGDYAFEYCTNMTSVTIASSDTAIGDHTFDGCSSLGSITIYDSTDIPGDVNNDGVLDKTDVVNTITHILGFTPNGIIADVADMNNDGIVDITDVTAIIAEVLRNSNQQVACKYIHDDTTGDEAIITETGDIIYETEYEDGGYLLEMCSYDVEAEDWSTEKSVAVLMDSQGQVESITFSDFSIILTPTDDGQTSLAILRHNGEYEHLENIVLPNASRPSIRRIEEGLVESLVDRLSIIDAEVSLITEPLRAVLTHAELNRVAWAGDLWGTLLGRAAELAMEHVGSDYSGTIGNLVSIGTVGLINIVRGTAAFNPYIAALLLLKSLAEGRRHVFEELIGKNFNVSEMQVKRVNWNSYKAGYVVSGISGNSMIFPQIRFNYQYRYKNVMVPQTISHDVYENKGYVEEMENLAPGPNRITLDVYISGYLWLGRFLHRTTDFFVGLNSLSDYTIEDYEENDGTIEQPIMAFSINHNEAYPLTECGVYIKHGNSITRYRNTENIYEADIPSGSPSIGSENSVTQKFTIHISKSELETNGSIMTPKTKYIIGAYSYDFNNMEYIYYDEDVLDLEYEKQTDDICPDGNHPHWIDLGLPSGTKWRCCNAGASTPEAYGGYYSYSQVSDVPTYDQCWELCDNCSFERTTLNGVQGVKFTGKNEGFTDKSIFLPAAGLGVSSSFYENKCCYMFFENLTPETWTQAARSGVYWFCNKYENLSVRPVRKK